MKPDVEYKTGAHLFENELALLILLRRLECSILCVRYSPQHGSSIKSTHVFPAERATPQMVSSKPIDKLGRRTFCT